jgi:hypothetical protein
MDERPRKKILIRRFELHAGRTGSARHVRASNDDEAEPKSRQRRMAWLLASRRFRIELRLLTGRVASFEA